MDIRQLSYVVAVADHGGFSRAAEQLGITQPSLSQGVRALENELGIDLFIRSGRQVRLTAAGEALVGPARQAQRDLDTARAAVDAVRGLRGGRLDLVTLPTLAADPISGLIGRFRLDHPEVMVRMLEPDDAAAVGELIRSGSSELGACELPLPDNRGLVTHELSEQEYQVVVPPATTERPKGQAGPTRPDHPIAIADLAAMPQVTTPTGTSTRTTLDQAFARAGLHPLIAVETDHREALIPLALAGAGAALVPETLALAARRRGAVTASVEPPIRRRVGLIHRDGSLSPAAAAFLEIALPEHHHQPHRPRARRR